MSSPLGLDGYPLPGYRPSAGRPVQRRGPREVPEPEPMTPELFAQLRAGEHPDWQSWDWFPYEAYSWTERCLLCKRELVDGEPIHVVYGRTAADTSQIGWCCSGRLGAAQAKARGPETPEAKQSRYRAQARRYTRRRAD